MYEKGDDPLLKLAQDIHLDKLKLGSDELFDYERLQQMPIPGPRAVKYEDNSKEEESC